MPTFNARGITSSLSIAPLDRTLSDTRVQKAFDVGQRLRERPIGPTGPNGRTPGVLQFLGANEDIPFLMAEASERLSNGILHERSMSEDHSSATPFDETPGAQLPAEMSAPSDRAIQSTHTDINLDQDPQAMMLTVATSTSSHIRSLEHKRTVVRIPDMKIEVFFNGALIGSEYINPRRANTKISTNRQTLFSGVRIHRRTEKPWVYREAGSLEAGPQTAQGRWDSISGALKEEAYDRGVDRQDEPSPSAEFLHALAAVKLPEQLKDAPHLAVIDIIVSTGSGGKEGSDSGFVLGPLRMSSEKFEKPVLPTSEEAPAAKRSRSTSREVPLAQCVGERPKKKAKHNSDRASTPAVDSPMPSPRRCDGAQRAQDRAELAVELGAPPTGRLVKQIAPPLPVTPSARQRLGDRTKDRYHGSPIKMKLSATRGTAKSWVKNPPPTSSDDHTSKGFTDTAPSSDLSDFQPSQTHIKTSRSAKEDPFSDEQALNNFQPPRLCEGSVVSFAGAGLYRKVPGWRPGVFDEDEVVVGMRFVVT